MTLVRAFVAIDVENPEIVKKVEEIQREVLRLGLDIKLVEKENLHLTLRFLGEIPQSRVNDIVKSLTTIRFSKFKIALSGLGVFPDLAKPRVLWIGVSKGLENLVNLANIVRNLVDKYAEHREDREFSPHLTIGRIKSGRNIDKLREVIERYREAEFGVIEVDKVKLKKSVLTPRGPIYSDLFVQYLT
ncbi:2'-5' RNA ligase [Pyrobaculum islandicum DSM 4184]|uniref:RNA 2',3'-cyclic phosphodiesterase n=1 Tax=Pyrobaculum islandicum (strain DSM 4184 / JCM 9189 / GEO3) TaxID=384616 RepID=A1RS17_PYRIL|nr:RNA 2',3'-cyclic phosphodiesterase [Pyrobaculum islandicum]ABL87749.1 2'-5' RNA ligase [Pyrobaculum islandicum DSM 4184]